MNDLMFDLIIDPSHWPSPEHTEEITPGPTEETTQAPAIILQPIGTPSAPDIPERPAKPGSAKVPPFVWVLIAVLAAAAAAAVLLGVLTKKKKTRGGKKKR